MTAQPARAAFERRIRRLWGHACEGLLACSEDPAYGRRVLVRLQPDLAAEPADLWDAVSWIWAIALGHAAPPGGRALAEAAQSLRAALLRAEDPVTHQARWQREHPGLDWGCVLRSHPFCDLRSWSVRKMFHAS